MHHLLLLPILLLSPPLSSSMSPSPSLSDYGRIIPITPTSILKPKTTQDISLLITSIFSSTAQNNITVAPSGSAHSTYGQSNAPGGVVIDMLSLPASIQVGNVGGIDYVDAAGGALWVDVLSETLRHGLTPRSWTDYLYLTVGGTLSVGGISGQTFKYGPQIANVLELDVITGKGEFVTCSSEENSDLFYGVLGGLGQFGIITRARIILKPAPQRVKRVTITYVDFVKLTRDQELLISTGVVDYLEGFVNLDDSPAFSRLSMNTHNVSRGSDVHYSLEMAIYYDDEATSQKVLDGILVQLGVERSTLVIADVSYFDFLNRVRPEEEELRRKDLWDVAHPWLNLFVPRAQIGRFKHLLLDTISDSYSAGPIIIYPTLTQKWDPRMSTMLPEGKGGDGIIYVASVLRAAPPTCTTGTPCLDALLGQNQKMIDIAAAKPGSHQAAATGNARTMAEAPLGIEAADVCAEDGECEGETIVSSEGGGMGAKQYMPNLQNEMEWMAHFGYKWERFRELKSQFDPLNILTPGQRIFERKPLHLVG